jgi:hypothetical protein
MQCLSCGFDNQTDMNFCDRCGSKLATTCSSCGFTNPSDHNFCGQCGTTLGASMVAPRSDQPASVITEMYREMAMAFWLPETEAALAEVRIGSTKHILAPALPKRNN